MSYVKNLPLRAQVLIAAVALVAVSVASGQGRGKYPALLLVLVIIAFAAERVCAHWSRLVAVGLAVDLLIPEDGRYQLASGAGFQLEPYRLFIVVLLVGWLGMVLADPQVRPRATRFERPIGLIIFVVITSDIVNPARLSTVGGNVIKALTWLAGLILLMYIVGSVIHSRRTIRRLLEVLVSAGCVEAVGAIVQRHTHYNIFDHLHWLIPIFRFNGAAEGALLTRGGGLRAFGSAGHPIELSNVMAMLMPIAAYLAIVSGKRRWWGAFFLLLIGEFASGSKTGIIELIAMIFVFVWLRRRETLKCWPALIPLIAVVSILVPGAISGIVHGFFPKGGFIASQTATFQGRGGQVDGTRLSRIGPELRSDYDTHNALFGEGYGTRIVGRAADANAQVLDDQWFGTFLETGPLGVLSWLWLFVHVVRKLGRRAKLERGSPDGWLPAALAASITGFAVSMGTYDAFGFMQAFFLLFIFVAFAAVLLRLPPLVPDRVAHASP